MDNWRIRSTSTDTPGNSSNFRPNTSNTRNQYFQQNRIRNVQNPEYSTSSLSFQSGPRRHFDLQRRRRGAFSVVEDLKDLNQKNSSEIIIELTTKLNHFGQMLMSDNLEPNWIVLIISILSKVCLSCFRETKLSILKVAINETFLQTLEKHVRFLKYQEGNNWYRNQHFLNNPPEFIVNLLFVCEFLIDIIPTNYCDILYNLLKAMELFPYAREGANLEGRQKPNSNIKILREKLNLRQEHPKQEIGMLSAYPNTEEILTSTKNKCFVKGKYENVKNYFDVQIQSLKENFAEILRQDIAQGIEHNSHLKSASIKIYPNVSFGSMSFDCYELGVIVNLSNEEDLEEIFSPRSRCLGSDSVVCFTKDNFSTIFFGSVISKNCGLNHLIIGFESKYKNYESNVCYTMVECNVTLYPYYHILQALTTMSEVDLPLKSYLIDAVPKVESPSYLDSTSSIYLGQGCRVNVFENNWPSAEQLKLDFTQYPAFKAALTQKFVMIQGDPGTGKTYLGLQIVKTLLLEENLKLWYNKTPILVVCLSNQVLDQFLEGLLSTTRRIIRVGRRSKSEKLANFALTNARRTYLHRNVLFPWKLKQKNVFSQLEVYHDCLNQINNFNNILNFSKFESIDEKIKGSWFSRASKTDILAWLFDEQIEKLNSLKISEIINDIKEEQKQCDSGEDNAPLGNHGNISDELEPTILWSKSHIWNQIVLIGNQVQEMESSTSDQWDKMSTSLQYLWKDYQYFKMKMSDRPSAQSVSKPNVDYQSPQNMDPNDRWNLYFYWLNLYKKFVDEKFLELQSEQQQLSQKITEILHMSDAEIMKQALVLGMTVASAARLHTTLQSLKCRIVVVEEAGKVTESHIMVSLTKHCENLILLGNHQEFLPIADKTRDNLGTNMMESMLSSNSMRCHVLSVQHRILPKIVKLLYPHSDLDLETDTSLFKCPPILGMLSNHYFIDHEHQEVMKYSSKANLYEAKFLVNLARYLRQVGYRAEDISILATYSGQTEILCDESKRHADLLKGVRISTLDNYLGEENKIVLLSLVRSNTEGIIGRLEFEKFVIFALSRAKEALYMMGNLNLLCEKSEIWTRVKEIMVKQNCVGEYLPVCCTVNPDHITKIEDPKDFDEVGGKVCSQICGGLLNCGHRCSRICHILEDHSQTTCTEFCSK